MLADPEAERARRQVARMCGSGLDAPSLLRGVAGIVAGLVGYDGAFWATTDPAALLITGAYVEALPAESAAPFYENEYLHDDVNEFSHPARGIRPVATLSEATGGELSRGRIHREVGRHFGFPGDNLKAAFMAGPSCWGVAALVRHDPRSFFDQADLSFMAGIGSHVGEGLRAAGSSTRSRPRASRGRGCSCGRRGSGHRHQRGSAAVARGALGRLSRARRATPGRKPESPRP